MYQVVAKADFGQGEKTINELGKKDKENDQVWETEKRLKISEHNHGTLWSGPTYTLWEFQMEEKEKRRENIWRNNVSHYQIFGKTCGCKHPKTQPKSPRMKSQITSRHIVTKWPKKKHKENFQINKRETTHHIQGILNNINGKFLMRNFGSQNKMGWYSQSFIQKKKKNVYTNWEYYIQQNCTSKCENKTFSDKQNLKECY